MNQETYDKTDHNKLAEQLRARMQSEIAEPVTGAKPKAPRKPRAETPAAAEVVTPAAPMETKPVTGNLEIFACDQNSPEWHQARLGIPTASSFSDVLAKGEGKTRRAYMLKLAGEILTGQPMEMVKTYDMERGHALEPEARDLYAFHADAGEIKQVGFLRRGRVGCSPDSLIGEDGGLEIKTKLPHLLIDLILKDEFPTEHKAQVQGALWITGRQWWDLAVYWPGLPLFVKRVTRDDIYIQNLANEVERFNTDLDAIVADMRARIDQEAQGNEFASAA